ncbi:selenocysteine-specific translation elongation factor [Leucobacter sp. GX24907]
MHVIATAGHVDHGKSTLVRALTGMEPDRWAEERRRGLTIDLGFAWTALPSGSEVAFVDVPGHERFLSNMLAGVGPAPVVCFVVAADQGWQAQSSDHRDAVTALGIERGLVVVTRADRADAVRLEQTLDEVRAQLRGTPLADAPVVIVSVREDSESGIVSSGLDDLRLALDEVLGSAPAPDSEARVRLWIDRSFTIRGAGTVVTGTLTAGSLEVGDRLDLVGTSNVRETSARGLHSRNTAAVRVSPQTRVAVNLRDIAATEAHRGDALVTPDAWTIVDAVDVRRTMGQPLDEAPRQLIAHIGTAEAQVRLRPFDGDYARLHLDRALPLQIGDRLVLRAPGGRSVFSGALVLDVDPPELARRGDGARRALVLAERPEAGDPAAEVARRGAVRVDELRRFGIRIADAAAPPETARAVRVQGADWWVHTETLRGWAHTLNDAVAHRLREDPLAPGLTQGAASDLLLRREPPLPATLLPVVVHAAELESAGGALRPKGHRLDLGDAEAAVSTLEERLREHPFAAPEADDLAALHLGARQLAAAERAGRLLRLTGGVVLSPQAPALAMRRLAALGQPFTTSEARQVLGTTRRVAIPLLEHLDARGWTHRIDETHRSVAR